MDSNELRAFRAGVNLGAMAALADIDVRELVTFVQEDPNFSIVPYVHDCPPDVLRHGAKALRTAYDEARSE